MRDGTIALEPLRRGGRGYTLPLFEPDDPGAELGRWVELNTHGLDETLRETGALLIRGFRHEGAPSIARSIRAFGNSLDYRYGVSPREKFEDDVYTSTELDPALTLPLHSELSFSPHFPATVAFLCITPAGTGGQTPIADNRHVFDSIPLRLRRRFDDGIVYVRNYPPDPKKIASWKRVFETDDPGEVERFCRERAIEFKWVERGWLHTKQLMPAVRSLLGGERVWFNQAHLFHSSTVGLRADLSTLDPRRLKRLPRNALFADESRIPTHVIRAITRSFQANSAAFEWESGDLLVLDNMRFSHGRMPFVGERKVLVAMSGPSVAAAVP